MELELSILLVDDEDIVRQTMGEFLRECGHQVDEAEDGGSALQALEERNYHAALVDIRMPGMDGFSLLTRIQEMYPDLVVVVVTGHGDANMEEEALRRGAVAFLVKPTTLLKLDRLLQEAVGSR